jgi:hypothetical protein
MRLQAEPTENIGAELSLAFYEWPGSYYGCNRRGIRYHLIKQGRSGQKTSGTKGF